MTPKNTQKTERKAAVDLTRLVRRLRGTLIPNLHTYEAWGEYEPGGHFEWLGIAIHWTTHNKGWWRSFRLSRHIGYIGPTRD